MSTKDKLINIFKRIGKGDFDFLHSEFIEKDGKIKDGHALPSFLIVFRRTGHDESKNGKNTVKQIGNSNYLLISETTKKMICNKNGEIQNPIQIGYNAINNNKIVIIDCEPKEVITA